MVRQGWFSFSLALDIESFLRYRSPFSPAYGEAHGAVKRVIVPQIQERRKVKHI